MTGVERQQRYRASRKMVSIDISRDAASRLQKLRDRQGWTNDKVIIAAAEALTLSLDLKAKAAKPLPASKATARKQRKKNEDQGGLFDAGDASTGDGGRE